MKTKWLQWATVLWGGYFVVWISLEGDLGRVIVLGFSTAVMSMAYFWQRYILTKRPLTMVIWFVATAVSGFFIGGGTAMFTFALMAVKTGLHTHGPEFSTNEISWMWQQLPLWSVTGLLAGWGLGLLTTSVRKI